jgi:hypothetical protein
MKKWIAILLFVLFCVVVLPTIVTLRGCMPNYSQGSRAGEIVKCSKKGLTFKSWECTVKLSDFGLRSGGAEAGWSNVFECSTIDEEIGQKLESLTGKKVAIKYHQFYIGPIWQSTDYTVTSVEEVK